MTQISLLSNPAETVRPADSVAPSVSAQNGNGHPANEPARVEERYPSSATRELVASLQFFESLEELQDIAVGLAFAEEDEKDIIEELETLQRHRIHDLENVCRAQEDFQKARIEVTQGRINREMSGLTEAVTKTAALETEDRRLREEVQIVNNEINVRLQQLKQERIQHEKEFFDAESTRLQDRQWQKQAVEDLGEEFALAEKVYGLKQRQYELNQPEFKRLAEDAELERKTVETQQEEIRGRLQRFQRLGVTRTTAGFLVHAGYASFAAVGALIAAFFHKRQDGAGDFLSRVISGVRSLVGLSEGGWALWPPFFNLVLLIAFGIFVVTVTTIVMHWLIGKLDTNWRTRPTHKRRSEESRFIDLLKSLSSRVRSFFHVDADDNQQSSRNRPNKDNSALLERGAFVQLLAHMPYIIGVAVLFFFFAALGLATNSQTGSSIGPLEISSTYIGVIFLTLSTSAAILYVTNVIEPRWHRHEARRRAAQVEDENTATPDQSEKPTQNDEHHQSFNILTLNWEVVVLVLGLVVSLGLSAFLPIGTPYNSWALGSVALFMALSSLGLAYGLVQRGLFKDFDVIERRRQDLLKQADSWSQLPKIEDVFDRFDSKEIGESFRDSRLTQHKLEDLRVLSQLNRIFGKDFETDDQLHDFLSQFVSSDISLKGLKRDTGTIDPLDGRFLVPQDKLVAIYSGKERLSLVGARMDAIREDLEKARSHAEKLNADLNGLYEELLDQQRELVGIQQAFSQRRQQLEINHKREILWLKSAYRIGKKAHELIQPIQPARRVPEAA